MMKKYQTLIITLLSLVSLSFTTIQVTALTVGSTKDNRINALEIKQQNIKDDVIEIKEDVKTILKKLLNQN